ncbi:MAG: tRNA-intron lyase [Conexivisphaera sp.]|jgi:tRNA-intron endonuclease
MEPQVELRSVPDGKFSACGDSVGWLVERGYGYAPEHGNSGCRTLEVYEALYLLERGDAIALGPDGSRLESLDLMRLGARRDDGFLTKYIVYRDLRNRGYVVREGYGIGNDLRVYRRGEYGREDARYLVMALEEGGRMPASRLTRSYLRALNLGKDLILAVVESRGDVVYYSIAQFNVRGMP